MHKLDYVWETMGYCKEHLLFASWLSGHAYLNCGSEGNKKDHDQHNNALSTGPTCD